MSSRPLRTQNTREEWAVQLQLKPGPRERAAREGAQQGAGSALELAHPPHIVSNRIRSMDPQYATVFTNAKAGMENVDQERVKRIVYEMSKVRPAALQAVAGELRLDGSDPPASRLASGNHCL